MIVFHEGLPRSGKSYEACVFHIIPALLAGRRVVTNIEGINHEQFAKLTELPLAMVRQFLVCVHVEGDVDAMKEAIYRETQKNDLVVIDEIQNLFPSEREKLTPEWTRYITEHGHDGMDIVLMGQDRRDCHNLWRRRIQRVITFKKMTALGRNGSYAWACLEAVGVEKFKQVTAGTRDYESKYFGLYKSFTDGTTHKEAYVDKRATVWNHWGFRFGIPLVVVALAFAGKHLYEFFTPKAPQVPQVQQMPKVRQAAPQVADTAPQHRESEPDVEPEYQPVDIFDQLQHANLVRLSAVVIPADGNMERLFAYVDVLDKTFHIKDRFTVAALRDLGWSVVYRESGLQLVKADRTVIVRPWPIDKPGRVDNDTRASLAAAEARSAGSGNLARAPTGQAGPSVVLIPHDRSPRITGSAF